MNTYLYPSNSYIYHQMTLDFQTSPNMMTETTDNGYKPICPEGYVYPDTPDSDRNQYIPGIYIYVYMYICICIFMYI
jgi:hypothetical protein